MQGPAPLVLCNYTIDDPAAPSVWIDHVSSIYQTTRYLIDLGHRAITLLNLDAPYYQPARMRRRGYELALSESRICRLIRRGSSRFTNRRMIPDDWRAVIDHLLDSAGSPDGDCRV